MKAFITEYQKNCLLCGRPTTEQHHLLYGGAIRRIADEDNIQIPICRECHNDIHAIGTCGRLSKLLGQALWELNIIGDKEQIQSERDKFRCRYGKSYM